MDTKVLEKSLYDFKNKIREHASLPKEVIPEKPEMNHHEANDPLSILYKF